MQVLEEQVQKQVDDYVQNLQATVQRARVCVATVVPLRGGLTFPVLICTCACEFERDMRTLYVHVCDEGRKIDCFLLANDRPVHDAQPDPLEPNPNACTGAETAGARGRLGFQ